MRVGIIFGGRSCEHEISLVSASHVMSHLDRSKYEVMPIGITKDGEWLAGIEPEQLHLRTTTTMQCDSCSSLSRQSQHPAECLSQLMFPLNHDHAGTYNALDVAFPVMHGSYGEDGTLQGLLEMANVPYVGCGVLGSALGMDKEKMKMIFRAVGLPIVNFQAYRRHEWKRSPATIIGTIEQSLTYPYFVKPANQGSSIGVTKVCSRSMLENAINVAAEYDSKIIIEQSIDCREFSCSVLGNCDPMVSVIGESIFAGDFYNYEAKYFDKSSHMVFPAAISPAISDKICRYAVDAFHALDLCGLARVDFFLEKGTGQIYINEVNTLPSFTPQCMYPKLCEVSGLPYGLLLDRLIELALERYAERSMNRTVVSLPLYA
ncbi:MAG: D-alanine--D-alanine ligase family protein [Ktedonobacteraceae bacterium]